MRKRWIIEETDEEAQAKLVRELKIPPIIARILINRNIGDPHQAESFLKGGLSSLHDPFLLKGMKEAQARIRKALGRGEKILVYGDYDVDGITGVALLSQVFKSLGGHVIEYIPNRLEEGYGLNLGAAQFAYRKKVGLVVTVDCGISAHKEIDYLNSLGIDTVVIDHHEPQDGLLPKAHSIIDPFQKGCLYPFKHLAGVGLAFKVVGAVLEKGPQDLREHLDLVALGTVSDVVPLLGENRILTKHGLHTLAKTKKIGIKELIRASGLSAKIINSGHIGYILGPRINASGRIGSPKLALRLLTTERPDEARELAARLNQENRSRQKIQSKVYEDALEKVAREVNFKEHKVIVLSDEAWHPGVIGIVASRLVDKFYRPTVMIALGRHIGKGSARSIKNFHLFDIISKCRKYLDSFGGHEAACGLTILPKFINKFKKQINDLASSALSPEDLLPAVRADVKIPLSRLSAKLLAILEELSPFGKENPEPVFISENLSVKHNPKLIGRRGSKVWVTDGGITCEALSFKSEELGGLSQGDIVSLAYKPSINNWRGLDSIELHLEDIKTLS